MFSRVLDYIRLHWSDLGGRRQSNRLFVCSIKSTCLCSLAWHIWLEHLTARLMSSCFCISSSLLPVSVSPCVFSAEKPSCFQPLVKSFTQKPLKQPVLQAHQRLPWVNRGAIHSQLECIAEQAWEHSLVCQMSRGTCPAMREQMDCSLSSAATVAKSAVISLDLRNTLWFHTTLNSCVTCSKLK